MLNPIASANTYQANLAPVTVAAAVTRTTQPAPKISSTAQSDSVHLSAAAQAHAMQQQGMTVKTIAANMGVSVQAVDTYLGINNSGGGGADPVAQDKQIAAKVQVNPPAGGPQP